MTIDSKILIINELLIIIKGFVNDGLQELRQILKAVLLKATVLYTMSLF